jgi:hypothetical membrane protein
VLSPRFRKQSNALSDLGRASGSEVVLILNFGLLVAGFLIMVYAFTMFRKYANYTSIGILTSVFMIKLLATFDQVCGFFHYVVPVPQFVILSITSVVYAIERK